MVRIGAVDLDGMRGEFGVEAESPVEVVVDEFRV